MTLTNGNSYAYQWDVGLAVATEDEVGTERRFANKHGSKSIPVLAVQDGDNVVYKIPNILLTTGRDIVMYSLDGEGETTEHIVAIDELPVYEAQKPDDYVWTDAELRIWDSKINEPYIEGADGDVLHTDGDGGRYWGKVDYSEIENTPSIPEKTSDLTNDSGYITMEDLPDGNDFVAIYGQTSYSDLVTAYNAGKHIYCKISAIASLRWPLFDFWDHTFYFVRALDRTTFKLEIKTCNNTTGWHSEEYFPGGGGGSSSVIDIEKYGIVQADYSEPFTAENYAVAHQNAVGFQSAIDEAVEAGSTKIIIPPGNYPLCYESEADTTYNAILDASGIDVYGYGAKLYVIYDEDGTNPYYTGENPRELCGTVIKTDHDVCGLHLVGERAYRHRSDSAPWKDASKGIGLTKYTNRNNIVNCIIELFSGDGIGCNSYMEQIAGWTDSYATFTSVDWDKTNKEFVADAYKFTSGKHSANWIDQTKPLLIRNSSYFLYTSAPLRILCFDEDEEYLGDVRFWQGEYFYFLPGTYYWYIQLTREQSHDTSLTESWPHYIGYGYYQHTTIDGCEIRLNQRGGLSNLPNASAIKNCHIHHNGGAYGEMFDYYDSTQFGIDIEDIYIHDITIQDSVFHDNWHDVLYRCWGISLIDDAFLGMVGSLNFCSDFYAQNTLFVGACSLTTPTPFGKKLAIGCTFKSTKANEIEVIDLSGYVPTTRTVNSKALSSDISLASSDIGAIAMPSNPSSGDFLAYNGSAWVAQSLPVYDGS